MTVQEKIKAYEDCIESSKRQLETRGDWMPRSEQQNLKALINCLKIEIAELKAEQAA